ncbi:MAG: hypothetical protein KGI37_10295 [Alphaproteobacteria bacterium]|nr:hypothetical protein [Alphaproteobacteria bacterium]
MDSVIRYFIDHWNGDHSVARTGWMGSLVAILLVIPTEYLSTRSFLLANHLTSLGDMVTMAANGNFTFAPPAFGVEALNQLVNLAVTIWWSVGSWRSCLNPANNPDGPRGWWGFKATIIITAVIQLDDLVDFIRTSFGG